MYDGCSCSINIKSSTWYRVHASSINACPVGVAEPVLELLIVATAVCRRFYLANGVHALNRMKYIACTFAKSLFTIVVVV